MNKEKKIEEIMKVTADYIEDEENFFKILEELIPEEKRNSGDYEELVNEYMNKAWWGVYRNKLKNILDSQIRRKR